MKLHIISYLLLLLLFQSAAAQENILARRPALSPDGKQVAFSYQGDIWVMNLSNQQTKRLTIHAAYESYPKWSPDGKQIAFSSNRNGNYDIFRVAVDGGAVTQLTFHSSNDIITDWTADNQLLFMTVRMYKQIEREWEIYTMPARGGTPHRLLDALGLNPVESPDGKKIAFVRGTCRISREQYKGAANRNIWVYDKDAKTYTQVSQEQSNDFDPQWASNNSLYYVALSPKSKKYNIKQVTLDDNYAEQDVKWLSNHKDDGIFYLTANTKGQFAYERQATVFTQTDKKAQGLKLNLPEDYRFDPIQQKTINNSIEDYMVSPNGKQVLLETRGEIFVKLNDKEKKSTNNVSKHAYRDRQATWLNDTTVIFCSDRDGQYDLYLVRSTDTLLPDLSRSLQTEVIRLTNTPANESFPRVSPDGKQILYTEGNGKLIAAMIDSKGKLSKPITLLDGWATPYSYSWSKDSRWITYSLSDLNFNSDVYIQEVEANAKPINISMHPSMDYNPRWSPDGSKLGFMSSRIDDTDIWFVWLKKEDWEKTKADYDDGDYYTKPEPKKKKKDKKTPKDSIKVDSLHIDVEDIQLRLRRVTSVLGSEGNLTFSEDGKTLYFSAKSPANKKQDLFKINWDGSELKTIAANANPAYAQLSADGKQIYFLSAGQFKSISLSNNKITAQSSLVRMRIDHRQEREQMFEEAWRSLDEDFYDPNFHGQDWTKLKAKYQPWALNASTQQDFEYIFNIMLGQVNASHMGLRAKVPESQYLQRNKTGMLGIEIKSVEKNGVLITRVLEGSPASKKQSLLKVNDLILAINGEKLDKYTNFWNLMNNTAGQRVLLRIQREDKEMDVIIRPTGSLSTLLYEEWIRNKKALTEKYSNGRLGYIHIRSMGTASLHRFEQELMLSGHGKEGIVIDVRYNGGGWTTDYLMAILDVRQHAYTVPRGAAKNLEKEHKNFEQYYPYSERLPNSYWLKPSVALCNQNSYSNAEIFSHAYKNLEIGQLVGTPTFGAVISTGATRLIDGSYVRKPFRGWFVKKTGDNMDFVPAVPQHLLENTPDCRAQGKDEQLKKAVDVLIEQLDKK
ncbi:MAG: S41 family peptidase [Saprospiraceae bacterium]|nr:S41 family peptidase [Saprospiraceae bacterium]